METDRDPYQSKFWKIKNHLGPITILNVHIRSSIKQSQMHFSSKIWHILKVTLYLVNVYYNFLENATFEININISNNKEEFSALKKVRIFEQ